MRIATLGGEEAAAALPALTELLIDAVDSGASVGFLAPLSRAEATVYWQGTVAQIGPHLRLFAAFDEAGLTGSAQLQPAERPNGAHRAEIAKLLVHRRARRRGLGAALMAHAEREALALGRTLLVLDTRTGDDAERLYRQLGWTEAGIIPRYVRSSAGEMTDTTIFYKHLA
jgi:GNAT superfamily N-acetyltransferase